MAGLVPQEREVEKLVPDDIEELRLVHKTVDNVLVTLLLLKCSKHPVPDTEPTSVILIQAIPGSGGELSSEEPVFSSPVGPVVHPVVRGCVEDLAENPEVPEELRVDEELVDEVELGVDKHLGGGDGQRQGEVKPVSHPAQALQHWLSENSHGSHSDMTPVCLVTSGPWSG